MKAFITELMNVSRLVLITFFLLGLSQMSFGQVKIGENPGVIDPASILEMESDSLVMVLPRMTTGDRSAISNPYPGAMIYNTSLSCIEVNVGSKATPDWQCLADEDDVESSGHNISFEISPGPGSDSITIKDAGGTLFILMSDLVSALNDEGGIVSDSSATVDWNNIANMPSDMQNNDQYITNSTTFDDTNEELDIVISNGGTDFSVDLSDLATDDDVTSEIGDTATALRNLINAANAADMDGDPTNEHNSDFDITGSGTDDSLSITDSGSTQSVDLGDLVTAMDDDGLATDDEVSDSLATAQAYTDSAVSASDAADGDKDPTNEYNTVVQITGTTLEVIDGGGTESVDLNTTFSTNDQLADTAQAIRNYIDSEITSSSGTDLDQVTGNEYNTDMSISGSGTNDSITVTDPGGTEGIDLGDLVNAMDDDGLATDTELTDTITQVRSDITSEIGDTASILRGLINSNAASDMDGDPTNEHNSNFDITGSGTNDSLSITDSGSTQSVDLGDLVTAMDDDGLATDAELTASDSADGDKDSSNEINTSFGVNAAGDSLSISDGGGTVSVGLAELVDSMNNHGLATDTELADTSAALRMYVDDNENHLGIIDQTLDANRSIITAGFDLQITGTGRVGIGDVAIPTNSKLFVDGLISSSSDRRLKKDITKLNYGLDEVLALNPVAYIWKDEAKAKMEGRHLGFIAQEVNEVVPELVRGEETENSYLSLTYDRLTPVLVNALKELNAELEKVKAELEQANAQNNQLKKENEESKSQFAQLKADLEQIKGLLGLNKEEQVVGTED